MADKQQLTEKQLETIKNMYNLEEREELVHHSKNNVFGGQFIFNKDNSEVWVLMNPEFDKTGDNDYEDDYNNFYTTEQALSLHLICYKYKGDLNKLADEFGESLLGLSINLTDNDMLETYLVNSAYIDDVCDQVTK